MDPDQARLLSGLICVQTVCKGYRQTTLVGKELRTDLTHTWVNSKFPKSWTLENQNLKLAVCLQIIKNSKFKGQIPLNKLKLNQKSYYYLQISAFWGWLYVGIQPQNPEFRNNPENFQPCTYVISTKVSWTGSFCFIPQLRRVSQGLYPVLHTVQQSKVYMLQDPTQEQVCMLIVHFLHLNRFIPCCSHDCSFKID